MPRSFRCAACSLKDQSCGFHGINHPVHNHTETMVLTDAILRTDVVALQLLKLKEAYQLIEHFGMGEVMRAAGLETTGNATLLNAPPSLLAHIYDFRDIGSRWITKWQETHHKMPALTKYLNSPHGIYAGGVDEGTLRRLMTQWWTKEPLVDGYMPIEVALPIMVLVGLCETESIERGAPREAGNAMMYLHMTMHALRTTRHDRFFFNRDAGAWELLVGREIYGKDKVDAMLEQERVGELLWTSRLKDVIERLERLAVLIIDHVDIMIVIIALLSRLCLLPPKLYDVLLAAFDAKTKSSTCPKRDLDVTLYEFLTSIKELPHMNLEDKNWHSTFDVSGIQWDTQLNPWWEHERCLSCGMTASACVEDRVLKIPLLSMDKKPTSDSVPEEDKNKEATPATPPAVPVVPAVVPATPVVPAVVTNSVISSCRRCRMMFSDEEATPFDRRGSIVTQLQVPCTPYDRATETAQENISTPNSVPAFAPRYSNLLNVTQGPVTTPRRSVNGSDRELNHRSSSRERIDTSDTPPTIPLVITLDGGSSDVSSDMSAPKIRDTDDSLEITRKRINDRRLDTIVAPPTKRVKPVFTSSNTPMVRTSEYLKKLRQEQEGDDFNPSSPQTPIPCDAVASRRRFGLPPRVLSVPFIMNGAATKFSRMHPDHSGVIPIEEREHSDIDVPPPTTPTTEAAEAAESEIRPPTPPTPPTTTPTAAAAEAVSESVAPDTTPPRYPGRLLLAPSQTQKQSSEGVHDEFTQDFEGLDTIGPSLPSTQSRKTMVEILRAGVDGVDTGPTRLRTPRGGLVAATLGNAPSELMIHPLRHTFITNSARRSNERLRSVVEEKESVKRVPFDDPSDAEVPLPMEQVRIPLHAQSNVNKRPQLKPLNERGMGSLVSSDGRPLSAPRYWDHAEVVELITLLNTYKGQSWGFIREMAKTIHHGRCAEKCRWKLRNLLKFKHIEQDRITGEYTLLFSGRKPRSDSIQPSRAVLMPPSNWISERGSTTSSYQETERLPFHGSVKTETAPLEYNHEGNNENGTEGGPSGRLTLLDMDTP